MDADIGRFEKQRLLGLPAGRDQVLDHFVLPVDRDRPASRQGRHVDAVTDTFETQVDALVPHALPIQPVPDACGVHQIHGPLLEHASAHAFDDVLLPAVLDDERLDPCVVKEMSEHQAGGTRAHDSDLRASGWHAVDGSHTGGPKPPPLHHLNVLVDRHLQTWRQSFIGTAAARRRSDGASTRPTQHSIRTCNRFHRSRGNTTAATERYRVRADRSTVRARKSFPAAGCRAAR